MDDNKQRELVDEMIDNIPGHEFMAEFVKFFGVKRAMSLIGWLILWGVRGIENGPEYRAELEAQGLSRTTAFRASADCKRFRDHLEKKYSYPVPYTTIVRKIGTMSL